MNILCAGEVMVEFAAKGDTWCQSYGGDTFNTAIYLAREGIETDYMTFLGDDCFSDQIMALLAQEKVGADLVTRPAGRQAGLYTIHNNEVGERDFSYWRSHSPAREMFDKPVTVAKHYDMFYFTGISLAISRSGFDNFVDFLKALKEQNSKIIFDPNYRARLWDDVNQAQRHYRAVLPYCHMVLPTLDDEELLWGIDSVEQCETLYASFGVDELLIKAPELMCHAYLAGSHIQIGAKAVKAVDTTGAGDSFNAAYIASRCRGEGVEDAIRAAQRLSAKVVQHHGAVLPQPLYK